MDRCFSDVYKQYFVEDLIEACNKAHTAPEVKDEEIDAAIHIVVSLYVFATMISVTDLEMGKNNVF